MTSTCAHAQIRGIHVIDHRLNFVGTIIDMAGPFGNECQSFGQRRPPLYEMIKNILREYPNGQIFKVSGITYRLA